MAPWQRQRVACRGRYAVQAEGLLACLQLGDSQEALAQQRTATEAATSQQQQLTKQLQGTLQQVADLEAAQQAVAQQAAEKAAKLAHLEGDKGSTHSAGSKHAFSILSENSTVHRATSKDVPSLLGTAGPDTQMITLPCIASSRRTDEVPGSSCLEGVQAQAEASSGHHASSSHLPELPDAPTSGVILCQLYSVH